MSKPDRTCAVPEALNAGADHPQFADGLIHFSRGDNAPALFLIHAVDGGMGPYAGLIQALVDDIRVIGLPAFDFQSRTVFPDTINEAAARYATRIIAEQESGPYYLAGWSLGGQLACEIARELARRGRTIARVFVLDSHAPKKAPRDLESRPPADAGQGSFRSTISRMRAWQRFVFVYLADFSTRMPISFWLGSESKRCTQLLQHRTDPALFAPHNALHQARSEDDLLYMLDTVDRQFHATWDVSDPADPVPIHFFKCFAAEASPIVRDGYETELSFWRELSAGDFRLDWVEGRHDAVLSGAGLQLAADKIRQTLCT